MKDAKLQTVLAFPAAGANNDHASIDLGPVNNPGSIKPGALDLEISWPALAALVDAKNVNFTVLDSADNAAFVTLGLVKTITGAGGLGVAAGTVKFRLPSGTRQFIRVNQAQDAAGGNITASSSTVSLIVH